MLASSINDLFVFVFIALFVVGPWIAKILKKLGSQPTSGSSSTRQKLEEMARRRLEELALQRRNPAQGGEPTNLTMAQRVQRARDKARYEQRARALREQPPGRPTPTSLEPATPTQRQRQEAPRRQEQQQRLARLRAKQLEQQARAQRQQQIDAAQRKTTTKHTTTQRSAFADAAQARMEIEHESGVVHRHVTNAPIQEQKHQTGGAGAIRLDIKSLRNAIVLKEVLDPPLALRNTTGAASPQGL